MIKKVGDKEKRIVKDILHKISRVIVDIALATKSIIVLGDLKGIRDSAKKKGRRMRRLIGNFTYFKLTEMIKYKAKEHGIKVVKINEAYTSKTCSRCGRLGKRINQGLFKCSHCNAQLNADFNGCLNNLKRFLEYISLNGGLAYPLNSCLT